MHKLTKKGYILIAITSVIIALALITLIFNYVKENINSYGDKSTIGLYHVWTVYFDKEITGENFQNIKVGVNDSKGNIYHPRIMTNNEMNEIFVYPPESGYSDGISYTLKVESNMGCSINKEKNHVNTINFKPKRNYKNTEVKFKDKNLENIIRLQANIKGTKIYMYDIEGITNIIANGQSIKELSGIEQLVNLRELYLDVNEISDIKPLSKLYNLEALGLSHNKITDLSPIKNLKLYQLSLSENDIKNYFAIKKLYGKLKWKDFTIK